MLSWKYLEGLNYPGCFSFRISLLHPSASQPLLPHISTPRPRPLHSSFPSLPSHPPHPDLCPSSKSAWHFNHGVREPDRIAKPPRPARKGVRVSGGRAAVHGAAANPLRDGNSKTESACRGSAGETTRKRGRCSFTSKQVVAGTRGRRASAPPSVFTGVSQSNVRALARGSRKHFYPPALESV